MPSASVCSHIYDVACALMKTNPYFSRVLSRRGTSKHYFEIKVLSTLTRGLRTTLGLIGCEPITVLLERYYCRKT